MVMADDRGRVFEHPVLRMLGRTGWSCRPPEAAELILLPHGSDLHILPGRRPVGVDPSTGELKVITTFRRRSVFAVSAFLSPAHTSYLLTAFDKEDGAPILPLYAYTALGWSSDGFLTAGVRVDADPRQDIANFPDGGEEMRKARNAVKERPGNRLIRHLAHCCTVYRCPAARNLFLGRYEAPLPTSPGCNARCIGCISLQESGCVPATQDRLNFVPTAEEIAEVALMHIANCEKPVVSFGQGCEGEPLTNWKVLEKAIRLIREQTAEGTINMNTNASMPGAMDNLIDAGLDSVRVSLNSAREDLYQAYFRPIDYTFGDVLRSMEVAKERDRFVSVNYFVFPGVTDEEEEVLALERLRERTGFDMVQWRNLNIDPDLYLDSLAWQGKHPLGMKVVMERLKNRFPDLRYGYFNPPIR
jgi:pyruvate-formate lyase-activating enzyme